MRACLGGLHDDRVAELARGRDRRPAPWPRRAPARPGRRTRRAARASAGGRASRSPAATALGDERPAAARSSLERRDRPGRPPQPLAALHGAPERLRGRLGIREGRHRARSAASVARPSALTNDGEHRLVRGRSRRGPAIAAPTSSASARPAGRRGRSRRRRAGRRARAAAPPRKLSAVAPSRACRPGSPSSPRRAARRERGARLLRERRQLEPGGLARVGAQDPEPAGVRDHGDAAPARHRLVESSAATSISSSSVPARITPAWRKSASTAASDPASAAVCEPAARGAGARSSALHREDRLLARERAARGGRTRAGSRTTRGTAARRRSPRRPPTTRAGRSTRRRPCCRSRRTTRRRGPRAPPARAARARARRSATRTRSCPAGKRARRERRVEARPRRSAMPRQFGPTRRAPWARTRASSRSCRSAPSLPVSAKPAEMTHSARTPCRERSSAASSTCSPGTQITARSTGSAISSIAV